MATKNHQYTKDDINAQYASVTGKGSLHIERLLPGSIEQIWAYLTEENKCAKWLASFQSSLKLGSPVVLKFNHANLTKDTKRSDQENCVDVTGVITACEPPRLLSYTWCWGGVESEVTFQLSEHKEGVLLMLDHRDITKTEDMINIASGWHTHLAILLDKLHDKTPASFWSAHERLKVEYTNMMRSQSLG